jgi:hypothetical protein
VRIQIRRAEAVIEGATGLQRKVLEHHAPVLLDEGVWFLTCSGCDQGLRAEDDPSWPCSTWDLVLEDLGERPNEGDER